MLQVLDLHNNYIESSAAKEISLMLSNKSKLVKIDISQNNLEREGIIIISKALQTINSLKVINLSFNQITSEASNQIASVLKNNPLLESLNISHNKLKSSGCINICVALKKQNYNLKTFNISCNDAKPKAVHCIAHSLKGKCALEIFNICGNRLDFGITTVMSQLKFTKVLRQLILNNSGRINHKAAENICQVIRENPLLEVLDIGSTQLQKLDAAKIFNALTNNRILQVLDASHNEIDDNAAVQLTHALSNNSALRELRLHRNFLSSRAIELIVFKIDVKRHIWVPHISDEDVKSAISTRIERINANRKANDQLQLSIDWD